MKNVSFLILISSISLLFSACSNEIGIEETTESLENISSEVSKNEESAASESSKEDDGDIEPLIAEGKEPIVSETEIVNEKNSNDLENTSVENQQIYDEIKSENFWEYYKNINENVENNDSGTVSIAEKISDTALQLPLLTTNEEYFAVENIEYVLLSELEEKKIIAFYQEPVSTGYLIDVDLSLLMELYPAQTYSLTYEEIEYGVMISEENPARGLIFVEVPELDLSNLKTYSLAIIK